MSLMDLLGVNSWDDVTAHLRRHYLTNSREDARRARARERQAFYRDAGDDSIAKHIDRWFSDPETRALRKVFIEAAKHNNVVKRVSRELATLYARPPRRKVGGAKNNERYQQLLRKAKHDQYMLRLNRYLMVHRQVLVGFRVWTDEREDRHPQIHLVTPDRFHAVHHPNDPLRPIAYIIDQEPQLAESGDAWTPREQATPRYLVWTNSEWFRLTRGGYMVDRPVDHPFERMPWLLAAIEPPDTALLDDSEGADLVAAQKAVWFLNVLHLKEAKSVNRQTAFTGDISGTPTGQSQESEVDLILGDGVTTQTIDRGVDLEGYRKAADHILERVAANYGIPPSVLRHEGATSGFEIELRRIGIRERRREQEPMFRDFEREFAELQEMVLLDVPDFRFSAGGWGINFSESETPMEPSERLAVFETERRLGLTDTIEQIMERDPDLSLGDALEVLKSHITTELLRNELMRPLQEISGSMGASSPGTNDFEANRAGTAEEDSGTPDDDESSKTLLEKVNAATALIRAGFDPVESLLTVGLDPITHVGLLPVTLKTGTDATQAATADR